MDQHRVESFPHSVDAERGLLCSLALQPTIFDEATILQPALFYIPAHKLVYQHLLDCFQDHGTTDFIIVRDTFRLLELSEIGGVQALSELYSFVPSSANWRFYVERLADLYQRRVTIQAASLLIQKCLDVEANSDVPVREMCEKGLLAIALAHTHMEEHIFREFVAAVGTGVKNRHAGGRQQFIEISGIRSLDLCLGGLKPGEQIVIGAETSYGKTALALQMATHVALGDQRKKVAVFSFEMKGESLAERIISAKAEVRMGAIRSGELNEKELEKMDLFLASVPDGRTIVIEDAYDLDINGIISRCRRLKATGELDVIIVDYLQLVSPALVRESSRQREVADISRRLKVLAGELGMVVIALSQLNDEGKLRESRAIGQDADIVLLIKEPKDSSDSFEREIWIDKARNGPRGKKIKVDFYGDYVSFSNKS